MTMTMTVRTTGGPAPAAAAPGRWGPGWRPMRSRAAGGVPTGCWSITAPARLRTHRRRSGLCATSWPPAAAARPPARTRPRCSPTSASRVSWPPPTPATLRRRVQVSVARLDLRWTGAGRLVPRVHDRGARHLFHPAAVTAQILLALAGLAAAGRGHSAPASISSCGSTRPRSPSSSASAWPRSACTSSPTPWSSSATAAAVDAAGVRLHLGTPAFYVESVSALLLPRRQRLVQAAAGVWAEWQFTSIIAIWLWLPRCRSRSPCCTASSSSTPPPSPPTCSRSPAWTAPGFSPTPSASPTWPAAPAARSPGSLPPWPAASLPPAKTRRSPPTPPLNGLVAAGLLATAGFFWYQLFGDLAATLTHHGPAGWPVLAAAAAVLARPALTATAPRLARRHRQRPRPARRHHLPAAMEVAHPRHPPPGRRLPRDRRPQPAQLGILAGHLHRTRRRLPRASQLRHRPRRHHHRHHRLRRPRHPRPRRHLGPQPPATPGHPSCHPGPHRRHRLPPASHPRPRPDMNTTRRDERPQITAVLLEAA